MIGASSRVCVIVVASPVSASSSALRVMTSLRRRRSRVTARRLSRSRWPAGRRPRRARRGRTRRRRSAARCRARRRRARRPVPAPGRTRPRPGAAGRGRSASARRGLIRGLGRVLGFRCLGLGRGGHAEARGRPQHGGDGPERGQPARRAHRHDPSPTAAADTAPTSHQPMRRCWGSRRTVGRRGIPVPGMRHEDPPVRGGHRPCAGDGASPRRRCPRRMTRRWRG